MWCVKCKERTEDGPIRQMPTPTGRIMLKTECQDCGTLKHKFQKRVDQKGGCDCQHQDGEGLGDIIDRIAAFFKGPRNKYSPSIRKLFEEIGSNKIASIQVCRSPIQSYIQKIIDFVSIKKTPYDKLFHLYMLIKLDDGRVFRCEKNQVISISQNPKESDADCVPVPLNKDILFGQFFMNAQTMGGADYFKYDPFYQNCQDYLNLCLKANGLLNDSLKTFIKQDVQSLVPPILEKLGRKVTDLAGAADVLIRGEGQQGCGIISTPNGIYQYNK